MLIEEGDSALVFVPFGSKTACPIKFRPEALVGPHRAKAGRGKNLSIREAAAAVHCQQAIILLAGHGTACSAACTFVP